MENDTRRLPRRRQALAQVAQWLTDQLKAGEFDNLKFYDIEVKDAGHGTFPARFPLWIGPIPDNQPFDLQVRGPSHVPREITSAAEFEREFGGPCVRTKNVNIQIAIPTMDPDRFARAVADNMEALVRSVEPRKPTVDEVTTVARYTDGVIAVDVAPRNYGGQAEALDDANKAVVDLTEELVGLRGEYDELAEELDELKKSLGAEALKKLEKMVECHHHERHMVADSTGQRPDGGVMLKRRCLWCGFLEVRNEGRVTPAGISTLTSMAKPATPKRAQVVVQTDEDGDV